MIPIQEMRLEASGRNVVDHSGEQVATCFGTHGAEVTKTFAALPKVVRALLDLGGSLEGLGWHSQRCWEVTGIADLRAGRGCVEECRGAREALSACGVDVG